LNRHYVISRTNRLIGRRQTPRNRLAALWIGGSFPDFFGADCAPHDAVNTHHPALPQSDAGACRFIPLKVFRSSEE
jgi:hypothetical protein